MSKPNDHLDWTDGNAAKIAEPEEGKKNLGFIPNERPPAQFVNWLFYIQDQWNKYFESVVDSVTANGTVYDAIVGVGGTHNTIPELIADPNIGAKKNVLVISPFVLNDTINLTQDGMSFTFKPQATISKGSAAVAIEISGKRNKIYGCRFQNFSDGSDECIRLNAGADYKIIRDCHFFNNETPVNDNGKGNSFEGNIDEV